MRILNILLMSTAGLGTAAIAAGPPSAPPSRVTDGLRAALHSMVVPPGQSNRPVDRGRGDDNASIIAIDHVCTSNTPAARRSAICPVPISPF
jgi:hypothetical protein